MQHLLVLATCFLFVVSSSQSVIPSAVINRSEQEDLEPNVNNDTLVFAHVIYRHGDRDLEGPMQLTMDGKKQLYELGQYFRRRYNKVLGNKYSPDKVYILSTDYDRAIMSAQVNLAGLFFPTDEELWNEDILWQPIPIHTLPHELDNLLHGGRKCPKMSTLVEYYRSQSPEVNEIYQKYRDRFTHWAQQSGMKIATIEDVAFLYKLLMSEKNQNKPIPDWAENELKSNGPLEYVAKVNYKVRGSKGLVRLRSGFLLKEMLERFSQKINSTLQPDRSVWFYSAHSSTIGTMLNALGVSELHIPQHGCSLQFELYKTTDNEHYLQLFYRQPNEEYPTPMYIPECGEKCSLQQFYDLYRDIIPGDFEKECSLS